MNVKSFVRRGMFFVLSVVMLLTVVALPGCRNDPELPTLSGEYAGVDLGQLSSRDLHLVAHYDVGTDPEKSIVGKATKWWEETIGGKVTFDVISADIYPTKLMAMVSAENAADMAVVSTGNWMPRFSVVNVIQPVDEFVDTSTLLDFEKTPYDEILWNGKHYAMYVMGSWAQCIWYNKTMFENNGVKTPREYWEEGNWNWDTFLEVAQELTQDTDNDKVIDQWGYSSWTPDNFAAANNVSMVQTNPNGTVDIIWDQEPYINALKFEQSLMNEYKVAPLDYSFQVNGFKGGKLAMSVGDRSFVASMCEGMTDEVDNAPLPTGPDQDPDNIRYIGNSLFWGLMEGAPNVDGARVFCAKMREVAPEVAEQERSELELTDEQLEVCDYADARSRIVYEKGFGTWESDRWALYSEAMLNNTPLATVLESLRPKLEQNIKDTLDAELLEVELFTAPPAETFEDAANILLTRDGLSKTDITAEVSSEDAIEGGGSYKIIYPKADNLYAIARTDDTKVQLPAFHRYKIAFDYKVTSGEGKMTLTIRPKATMNEDITSFGFESLELKAGESGRFEATIDVMTESEDNVLLLLGDDSEFTLLIDNFSLTEE